MGWAQHARTMPQRGAVQPDLQLRQGLALPTDAHDVLFHDSQPPPQPRHTLTSWTSLPSFRRRFELYTGQHVFANVPKVLIGHLVTQVRRWRRAGGEGRRRGNVFSLL